MKPKLSIEILFNGIKDPNLLVKLERIYQSVRLEFETKPSSIKYHHTEPGGMGRHVLEVMTIAVETYDINPTYYQCSRDEVILAAFVHDFNKLGRYRELAPNDWRRQAKYGGQLFEYTPDKLALNETAETVQICERNGIRLSATVVNAITFHHGGWSADRDRHIGAMTPLAVLLHFADVMSTKL